MRINLNIDDELLAKIDEYAAEKYINRTAAICVLISDALQNNEVQKSVIKIGSMKDLLE